MVSPRMQPYLEDTGPSRHRHAAYRASFPVWCNMRVLCNYDSEELICHPAPRPMDRGPCDWAHGRTMTLMALRSFIAR